MIDVSDIVNDPDFTQSICIERITGGDFVNAVYTGTPVRFSVTGILQANEKGTTSIGLTPEGARATGYITVYLPANTPIYTTHDNADGTDISDKIVTNPDTPQEQTYSIYNVVDYSAYGYWEADAIRDGAI